MIVAVVLLPWLTVAGNPIITTLSDMARTMDLSENTAKLAFTMPNLTLIATCLIGGAIVGRKISYKAHLTVATLVMAVSGTAIFFIKSFAAILVVRGVFGLAMGFMTPLSSSLIFRLYGEDRRAKVIGMNTASMYISTIAYTLLGGAFGARGWHYVYLIHILSLIPMAIVLLLLPDVPLLGDAAETAAGNNGDENQKTSFWERLPPKCLFFVVFNFIFMLMTFPIQINVSFILSELGIEGASTAGLVLIVNTIAGAAAGILFGFITRAFRRFSLTFALAISAAGMVIASMAGSLTMLMAGSAMAGGGIAMINIAVLLEVSYYVKKENIGLFSGVNMAVCSFGAFSASAYTELLARLGFDTAQSPLMVSGAGIVVLLAVFAVFIIYSNILRKRSGANN